MSSTAGSTRASTVARQALAWLLAALGLYAASLSILGAADALSTAAEKTEFQRGHTAVSAFWGVVAFTALLIGLRRSMRVLRLAALGLFALALGKLFLYDLSTLSSVSRALSFLAVGSRPPARRLLLPAALLGSCKRVTTA